LPAVHSMTEPEITTDRVAAAEPPVSYGARLAWARQRAGLTVTDIAARLRLHPNQVRAIEQENLSALPELAYVRGFVRSYARVVQVDAEPLLADLNSRLAASGSSVVDGMATESDSPVRAAAREQNSKRWVIGLAIVALIALGVIGWYANERAKAPAPAAPAASVQPDARVATAPPATAAPAPVPAPAAEVEALLIEPVSTAASEPAAPAALLRLRFAGPSWLHVVDGSGKAVLSGVQPTGSEHDLQGPLPLAVTIGDAGKATVEIRGERFDLTPVTRSNVARFKVE
jgi:cytoskeleton protein RodZ